MKNREFQNWAFGQSLESIIRSETGVSDITPEKLKEAASDLSPLQRRQLRRTLARYAKAQSRSAEKLREALTYSLFSGIKGFAGIFARGAAIGISVAGVINTIAPGLFSTLCGYLAGSANGKVVLNTLFKAGLVTLGVFTPPAFTQYAILVIGAAMGILIYAACIFFRWSGKKLVRFITKRHLTKESKKCHTEQPPLGL